MTSSQNTDDPVYPADIRDCDSLHGLVMSAVDAIMDDGVNPAGNLTRKEVEEHREGLMRCLAALVAGVLDIATARCLQVNAAASHTELDYLRGANGCAKSIASLHEAWRRR